MVGCSDGDDDGSSATDTTGTAKTWSVGSTGYDTLSAAVTAVTSDASKGLSVDSAKTIKLNKDVAEKEDVKVATGYTGDLAIDFGTYSYSVPSIDFGSAKVEVLSTGSVETKLSADGGTVAFVGGSTGTYSGSISLTNATLKVEDKATMNITTFKLSDAAAKVELDAAATLVINTVDFASGVSSENFKIDTGAEDKPTIIATSSDGATKLHDVKVVDEATAYVVEANGVYYSTLKKAMDKGGDIKLLADASLALEDTMELKEGGINLNGKTVSVTFSKSAPALKVVDAEVSIKNGKLSVTGNAGSFGAFVVEKGSLTLEDVVYTSNDMTAFKVIDGALTVKDSTVTSTGWYGIATNATEGSKGSIVLDNTKLTCHVDGDSDTAAICLNNGSTLSITNGSVVTGDRQVVMVRAGSATLSDATLTRSNALSSEPIKGVNFGSGNEVPQAALFIGNNENKGYNADAKVVFAGKVTIDGAAAGDTPVVMCGNSLYSAVLNAGSNWDGQVKVYDTLVEDSKHVSINFQEVIGDTAGSVIATISSGKVTVN